MEFGITTNALQIEGGCNRSGWWAWANASKIADGTDPYVACEHYARYKEDAGLIAALGVRRYRMSVDWARIEPAEGRFDADAMRHYADEIRLLKEKGVETMVTLHCFSNPVWFEQSGGFETPGCWTVFSRFASYVAEALKELICDYVTFNEPNTYAMAGYVYGIFPPGVTKLKRARRVMSNLCACHIEAYKAIHSVYESSGKTPRVSAALQFKVLAPKYRTSLTDNISRSRVNKLYQRSLSHGIFKGVFLSPLRRPKGIEIRRGKYYDFVGVNYFTRTVVNLGGHGVKEDVPVTDSGLEIYPEGLTRVLRAAQAHFPDAPFVVTANGADDRADSFRCRFIAEHIRAAESSGVPVEAYYYDTLMDCFEWLDGIAPKYGLYETDFGSQERTLRQSGEFYREVALAGGLTDELVRKYVEGQEYKSN